MPLDLWFPPPSEFHAASILSPQQQDDYDHAPSYSLGKIAIPNNTKLSSLGWNKEQGYIACGGENGLLKVLKLDTGSADPKARGLAAPTNLSMNQALEGHNGAIEVIIWNEHHQKLTTSDSYGLIIVWSFFKDAWYEEMINNRNKSVVKDMSWNMEGQRICIIYEDGAVIVGSVDGNRIWGKELKQRLLRVTWSPDSRLILFALGNGEVHIYDSSGGYANKLNIQCLSNVEGDGESAIVALAWYDGKYGYVEPDCPALVVVYDSGRMQIMRNESDDVPILVDTGMKIVDSRWNHNGSVLAVAGFLQMGEGGNEKDWNVVQFYSPFGEHLRTLRVPGQRMTACSWEGNSLRIALSVDSYIFFANIRPDYKWTHFAHTVVYAFSRPEQSEPSLGFWNHETGDIHFRPLRSLIGIASAGDHCVLATRQDDASGQFHLHLCNAIGTTVDSKTMELEPICLAMNKSQVIACSKDNVYVWQYRTAQSGSSLGVGISRGGEGRRERLFHIDRLGSIPSGGYGSASLSASLLARVGGGGSMGSITVDDGSDAMMDGNMAESTADPICCVTCSDSVLLIGRESGSLLRLALPGMTITNTYKLAARPYRLHLNSNSRRLAIVDVTGLLSLLELEGSGVEGTGEFLKLERKDVWDVRWACDNPELFAVMEKTRMYIFRNLDPEEPVTTSGYICSFSLSAFVHSDLEIQSVLLDDIMQDPENPSSEHMLTMETKSLRDTRELLEKIGLAEAEKFVEDNPHPRLWRLLAESALDQLDLDMAESSFVRCKDYAGIQFVKKLRNIQGEGLRRAEVAAYFKSFDEAERCYLEMDRRDLAIALRRKLGDYFRVIQLLKIGSIGTDAQMSEAWDAVADYFYDRQKW
ncbi:unnamed protein product [Cyprideis torosa]|uniref:Uncharacterized protein n=1 Tax=Cyprideis torosa TaxID=163714 RepID=A0A7R8WAY4_9CRUS|nr:unnamed protein product [Cyprideis torosa]CAG0891619.1 unnamed protein product [Cyprideis torosa]